jgi:hypothetical protein
MEYATYAPKGGLFARGDFFEITKLKFVVNEVKDSNNQKFSYITKTGTNPNDEAVKYTKQYVIVCDGKSISLPFDFYTVDTVFFSNMHPKASKDKGIYSSVVIKGKSLYKFPLDFSKEKFKVEGTNIMMDMRIRDYEMAKTVQPGKANTNMEFSGRIVEDPYEIDFTIEKFENKGVEKITTPAGTYDCQKLVLKTDMSMFGRGISAGAILYYNTEVGFVKSESQQAKAKVGYVELVSVKK